MSHSTKQRDRRGFDLVHPHAAGIDIGSKSHYVAVDPECDPEPVRIFECLTPDLVAMGEWLKSRGVTSVAMESTGVYWVPVARMLEEEFGIEVRLVDPKHVRCVPGRKTDIKDCQWLQQLHSYGLLSGAFRPAVEIEPLKTYWRHRKSLVESIAQHVQRMQKALEVMNVQLHKVLSDITGQTGMKILRAIVEGERDPVTLAKHRDSRVKRSSEDIVKALTGNYLDEQLFALGQALDAYDFFHQQILACDQKIETYIATLATRLGDDTGKCSKKTTARRKNQAHFDLRAELVRVTGVDLTRIPGIDALTAQTIISEIGVDVSAFPTEKHFASWLALCPNHQITGGRVRRRKTRPSASRVATCLRVAAQTLHKSQTATGAFYRRKRTSLGAPKAVTAAAHMLARLVYRMLKYGETFVEKGLDWYETQYRERALANLKRRAKSLGFDLVPSLVS